MDQKSICGNSCDTCPRREEIRCPGCRLGPGKYIYRECDIAQCCGAKNILSCEHCYKHEECQLLEERAQRQAVREPSVGYAQSLRPPITGTESRNIAKWLKIMFVCGLIALILSPLSSTGQLLSNFGEGGVATLGYGLALLLSPAMTALGILSIITICSLWKYAPSLKKELFWSIATVAAAVVVLICIAVMMLMAFYPYVRLSIWQMMGGLLPTLIFMAAATFLVVASVMSSRSHYHGLSELFEKVDVDLSDDILSLWNWYIWYIIFFPVAVFVTAILLIALSWWVLLIALPPLLAWGICIDVRYYRILWQAVRAFEALAAKEEGLGAQ